MFESINKYFFILLLYTLNIGCRDAQISDSNSNENRDSCSLILPIINTTKLSISDLSVYKENKCIGFVRSKDEYDVICISDEKSVSDSNWVLAIEYEMTGEYFLEVKNIDSIINHDSIYVIDKNVSLTDLLKETSIDSIINKSIECIYFYPFEEGKNMMSREKFINLKGRLERLGVLDTLKLDSIKMYISN